MARLFVNNAIELFIYNILEYWQNLLQNIFIYCKIIVTISGMTSSIWI